MIISIIIILFITFGFGLPLILLLSEKVKPETVLGLSFPIGIGIFTLLMFFSNIIGVKITLVNEIILLTVLIGILIPVTYKKIKYFFSNLKRSTQKTTFSSVEKIILAIILFLIVSSFISTMYWPVYMWDSVTLYDFRGHVFAYTGFMKEALTNEYFYSYPLLTSLAHSIIYLSGGKYPEFLYSMFYSSLGLGFYGMIHEFVSRKLSLFFVMLLLMVEPLFSHSLYSYSNLTYTVYLGLGAILIYLWDKSSSIGKNNYGYLILSGLMIGISTWVRSTEPFWLAAILIVLAISIIRKRFWSPVVYFALVYPVIKSWKVYQTFVAGNFIASAGQSDHYGKIWSFVFNYSNWTMIIRYLYDHVLYPWGSMFVLFVLAFVIMFIQRKAKDYLLMFLIVIIFLAVLVGGIFIFSVYLDYWYRIGDAIERLSMLFYPLFVYSIALVISNIKDR